MIDRCHRQVPKNECHFSIDRKRGRKRDTRAGIVFSLIQATTSNGTMCSERERERRIFHCYPVVWCPFISIWNASQSSSHCVAHHQRLVVKEFFNWEIVQKLYTQTYKMDLNVFNIEFFWPIVEAHKIVHRWSESSEPTPKPEYRQSSIIIHVLHWQALDCYSGQILELNT